MASGISESNRRDASVLELRLSIDNWNPLHGWLAVGDDDREFRGWTGLSATLEDLAQRTGQDAESAQGDARRL